MLFGGGDTTIAVVWECVIYREWCSEIIVYENSRQGVVSER